MGNCLRNDYPKKPTLSKEKLTNKPKDSLYCFGNRQINIITNIFTLKIDKSQANAQLEIPSSKLGGVIDELETIGLIDKDEEDVPPMILTDEEIRKILNEDLTKKDIKIVSTTVIPEMMVKPTTVSMKVDTMISTINNNETVEKES